AAADGVAAAVVYRGGAGAAAGVSDSGRDCGEPAGVLVSTRGGDSHQRAGADFLRGGCAADGCDLWIVAGLAVVEAGGKPGDAVEHAEDDAWSERAADAQCADSRTDCADAADDGGRGGGD